VQVPQNPKRFERSAAVERLELFERAAVLLRSCPKAAESSRLRPDLADLDPDINPERRTTAPKIFPKKGYQF